MENNIAAVQKDDALLKIVRLLYILVSVTVILLGISHRDPYEFINAFGTLALIPALYLARRLFHLRGGQRLEILIYGFICLSWTLGGAASLYSAIPGFDKAVHCLSGVFVSMLALTGYGMLEPDSPRPYTPTVYLFVFFASMAVAAIFEICEFTLAPIFHRDLQHVLDTGVGDTMLDILVCLLGTLVFLLMMRRSSRKKPDYLIAAAEDFGRANPLHFKS